MGELYQEDGYLKEFETTVKSVSKDKFIVLERTAFYPSSGGQLHDTGIMTNEAGEEFKVVFVGKFSGTISHEVDKTGLKEGDKVKCKIDWNRRYRLMRYHTTAHILSSIITKETGAKISGNQLYEEKARIDFNLEDFDREKIKGFESKVNEITTKSHEVKSYFLSRDDVDNLPESQMMNGGIPKGVEEIRIVDLGEIDRQMCGGTHVKNTEEIGPIEITKIENKGKNNRRAYFILKD